MEISIFVKYILAADTRFEYLKKKTARHARIDTTGLSLCLKLSFSPTYGLLSGWELFDWRVMHGWITDGERSTCYSLD